jgi:hypothetical protein
LQPQVSGDLNYILHPDCRINSSTQIVNEAGMAIYGVSAAEAGAGGTFALDPQATRCRRIHPTEFSPAAMAMPKKLLGWPLATVSPMAQVQAAGTPNRASGPNLRLPLGRFGAPWLPLATFGRAAWLSHVARRAEHGLRFAILGLRKSR